MKKKKQYPRETPGTKPGLRNVESLFSKEKGYNLYQRLALF